MQSNASEITPFPGEKSTIQAEPQPLSAASSQSTAPLSGEASTCKQKVMKNVRWVTALTGLGLCVAAVVSFLSCLLSFSLSGLILCVYLFPIGVMIAITETEKFFYARVVAAFPMLRSHIGRGIAYIFCAGLTISVGTIACYIVGFTLLAEGIFSVAYHFSKDKREISSGAESADSTQLNSLENGTAAPAAAYNPANDSFPGQQKRQALPTSEPGSRSLSDRPADGSDFGKQDAGHGFGSSAAAAAFDFAAKNPEQAASAARAAYGFAKANPELANKAAKHANML